MHVHITRVYLVSTLDFTHVLKIVLGFPLLSRESLGLLWVQSILVISDTLDLG